MVFSSFTIKLLKQRHTACACVLEVCGSTRTRGYTRTRPVPAGMGRVQVYVLRVGSGTGTKSTGTGIPVFTRKEHHFTARRYASAVLAVIMSVCLSVRLSVRHKSELYKDG